MVHNVNIVPATSADSRDLFDWRNEPSTRGVSKNKELIDWETHAAWFADALVSPDRTIHVGLFEFRKIGWVRFDRLHGPGEKFLVSILIAPGARGRGLGRALLSSGIATVPNSELEAEIAIDNYASRRIFEACGFENADDASTSEFLRYRRSASAPPGS